MEKLLAFHSEKLLLCGCRPYKIPLTNQLKRGKMWNTSKGGGRNFKALSWNVVSVYSSTTLYGLFKPKVVQIRDAVSPSPPHMDNPRNEEWVSILFMDCCLLRHLWEEGKVLPVAVWLPQNPGFVFRARRVRVCIQETYGSERTHMPIKARQTLCASGSAHTHNPRETLLPFPMWIPVTQSEKGELSHWKPRNSNKSAGSEGDWHQGCNLVQSPADKSQRSQW